ESLKKLKETIADTLKNEIRFLQEKNEKKLEEMRQTVDEKLQSTLEKRLSESFKTVSSQLENVYKGLGEMNNLAKDVGDLKKVLSNVKSRGVFGELQLKNLLEDILTKEQFEENARIKKNFSVEFAVKIPSKDDNGKHILLPIDSKFPREDYEKILDAQQKSDPVLLEKSVKALADRIKGEAKDIFEKYINPPETTDFALLFLPSEGLFAEVLRIPGFFEDIRKNYNIVITGPTTITAILNSLQMGFRTLAIEKRSHEVWKVLGSVKKEFQTFGENLAKTRKKLEEAADNIEKAEKRTQIIGKKLKEVEASSAQESKAVLGLEEEEEIQEDI
ncbi:MAG: DNA recombination protein RmuC, partial [Elusimicrobia bacterium]|nr:DNA recombination protein RmuC [Elusimicrobiota bacterium]